MKTEKEKEKHWPQWKTTLHEVIFGTETPAGRTFDVILMISISFSVLVVFLDSVQSIHDKHGDLLYAWSGCSPLSSQ
jgi:voltage-gated potassium channel